MKLLVTMGCDPLVADAGATRSAAIVLIDWTKKEIVRQLSYNSPPESAPPPGHMTFSHGQLVGNRLRVPTATELVTIDLDRWEVEEVITRREFNDVHHVLEREDRLYVCNTGLQAVLELSREGELREVWGTNGKHPWEVYDPGSDYRHVETKPHDVHPNHLVFVGEDLWVTRFNQCDAVLVSDHSKRMRIDVGNPHDGLFDGEHVYFTTTNGHVVACDPETGERVRDIDLYQNDTRRRARAWCRGLAMIDSSLAFVGMTQLRPTKWKNMAHWVLLDGKARLPSRIALYDLDDARLVDEMYFKGRWEGAAIYSILRLP
jgi:hypothetical protein